MVDAVVSLRTTLISMLSSAQKLRSPGLLSACISGGARRGTLVRTCSPQASGFSVCDPKWFSLKPAGVHWQLYPKAKHAGCSGTGLGRQLGHSPQATDGNSQAQTVPQIISSQEGAPHSLTRDFCLSTLDSRLHTQGDLLPYFSSEEP
ncbi:Versican core protein [Manis javanica]|nr:Versican core protein [Manis javanica]